MEVNWKNVGLGIAGLGGLGYLAYKYYNAKEEEKEEYAFKRAQRAKKHAKEETKQELLQERIIEEIEAPFARYCAEMGEFGFGKGFLDLQAKLKSKQEKVDSSANLSDSTTSETSLSDEQKMQEINAYITDFSPTQDELLKVLSLGQEMFDRVSKAKPFAQFIQASKSSGETTQEAESEQNTPSDMAKELTSLYAAVITSLSGDKEQIVWGGGCIFPIIPSPIYDKLSDTKWRHQWLFNTGLTLPLQVCMMKHLQSVFGIEPANFTTAVSKLAKAATHKYRIIGLDDDKDDEPKTHISSVSRFISVPIKIHQQTPRAMKSGIYAYILRDIGREYSRLLVESNGDKAKLESSIEAWDSAALTL